MLRNQFIVSVPTESIKPLNACGPLLVFVRIYVAMIVLRGGRNRSFYTARSVEGCLCLFLMGNMILNNTHTHTLIPTLCSSTVGQMMSFTCGAVGGQRLFCSCANICTHIHTHMHTVLPVCGSREQIELKAHVATLCRGKWGIYHSFTVSFIKPGEQ